METGQSSEGKFLNSTGVWVEQVYQAINYKVPGKIYPSISFNRKESHSLLNYAHRLISFLLSIQLKNIMAAVTFQQNRTLHSVYKKESLAILTNSIDLHSAICKAQQYNIPLFQVVMLTKEGQAVVKQKLLLNFALSHFINQNFVLYGDWLERKEIFDCLQQMQQQKMPFDYRQGIYFRKGELIYAFISLQALSNSHQNILQQNFTKVRNMFYLFESQKECRSAEPEPDLSPQPSSELQPQLSRFGVMGMNNHYQQQQQAEEFIDNFNDSDNQMELQP